MEDRTFRDREARRAYGEPEGKPSPEGIPATWQKGDLIAGPYEVMGILGEGAFGTVYRVYHRQWEQELAVKSPREEVLADREVMGHFLREAETWVNLGIHPNVVTCFYVRELGRIPRIFLEYMPGRSLRARIAEGLVLSQALDYAIQICRGMAHAQRRGLVHRDLKPENCLLAADGSLKVTDFGLVRVEEVPGEVAGGSGGRSTRAGTPEYMAPEQWERAWEATSRADVWALGVMLYEMVCGRKPFKAGEEEHLYAFYARLIRSNWHYEAPPEGLSRDLVSLIGECLQVEPEARPESFTSLEERLAAIYAEVVGRPYPRGKAEEVDLLATSLNNRGVSLHELGRREDALSAFAEAIKVDSSHPEATYNQAVLLWQRKEITDLEVVERLENVASNHPGQWRPLYLLGVAHALRRDAEGAERALGEATRIAPEVPEPKEALEGVRTEKADWPRLLRILGEDANNVESVAISPDGRFALAATFGNLELWDLASGALLRTHKVRGWAECIAISPEGHLALSGGSEGTLHLWDLVTAECLRTFGGHKGRVYSVAISPDGRRGLSGGEDGTLRLWDLRAGECLHTFEGHTARVNSVTTSPDGGLALSGSGDYSLRLWDLATRECLRTFEGHNGAVTSTAISPDGRFALSGSWDATLCLWDLKTGNCLRVLMGHKGRVDSVAISLGGHLGLSGGNDGTLRLWDLRSGEHLRSFEGHDLGVKSVAFFPDGRRALSAGRNGGLRLWHLGKIDPPNPVLVLGRLRSSEREVSLRAEHASIKREAGRCLEDGDWAGALSLLRKARALPGYERHPELLDLWARVGGEGTKLGLRGCWCARSFEGHKGAVNSAAISPNGLFGLSGSDDATLRLWDLGSGEYLRSFDGHQTWVKSVAISPDGRFGLSGSEDETIRLWDLESGQCVRTFEGHNSYCVAISPDGRFSLSGSEDGTIRLWDLESGQCVRTFEGHEGWANSVAISPDGRLGLSASDDKTLRLWDLRTGECVRAFEGDDSYCVAISPDGRFALSGEIMGLQLWDLGTGERLHTFEGHTDVVNSVVFIPDGRFALSGSADNTLRLWDVRTKECLRVLEGHKDQVNSVAISPDGRFALSGSRDNTLRLWEVDWEYEFPVEGQRAEGAKAADERHGNVEPREVAGQAEASRLRKESWWKRMFKP